MKRRPPAAQGGKKQDKGGKAQADADFIFSKLAIVSGALGSSPLIYALVIVLLWKAMPLAEGLVAVPALGYALVAVGVLAAAAAVLVRAALLEPERLARRIAARPSPPGQPPAYRAIMTAQIIPTALAEAAGILGIVLFVLTRDLLGGLMLAGISLSCMLMLGPRRAALTELLERVAEFEARERHRQGK